MSALATLVLVWLGAEKPDAQARSALEQWAASHASELREPLADAGSEGIETAQPLAERCDEWLSEARDQQSSGDDAAARRTLAQVEQLLRAHPELPQASWLMAERYRLEAQIAEAPSPGDAAAWHARADALEGGRALSFGDNRTPSTAPAKVAVDLFIHGTRRQEIYWDGAPASDRTALVPGEHHLLIWRAQRVAWAGWVSVLVPGAIHVWVPDIPACTSQDFEGVTLQGSGRVRAPKGVRCPAWAAAAPGPRYGTMTIASCSEDRCEPATTLTFAGQTQPEKLGSAPPLGLPAWATWTIAAVGATAVTSVVLWRAGAFETKGSPKVLWDGSGL